MERCRELGTAWEDFLFPADYSALYRDGKQRFPIHWIRAAHLRPTGRLGPVDEWELEVRSSNCRAELSAGKRKSPAPGTAPPPASSLDLCKVSPPPLMRNLDGRTGSSTLKLQPEPAPAKRSGRQSRKMAQEAGIPDISGRKAVGVLERA